MEKTVLAPSQTVLLGPPGTGKTTNLIARVEEALASGLKPEEIMYVSFTKKAVQEARDRACAKFNLGVRRFPYFQTIHSLCFHRLGCTKNSLLSKQNYAEIGEWLGYNLSGNYDTTEGLLPTGAEPGDKLLFLDSLARARMEDLREVWQDNPMDVAWYELKRFADGLAKYKAHHGLMDFTDMLYRYMAEGVPVIAKLAFVDEAQDLSRAQWEVLKVALRNVPKVVIAGDDDQSIYKWSGADLQTFLNLGGSQIVLSHSYRLPRSIHKKANDLIHQVSNRYPKEFTPRDAEGKIDYVMMMEQADINPDEDTLILVRNVYLLNKVYEWLHQQSLTYTGRHGLVSVKPAHVHAIVSWERMRKGHPITLDDVKAIYEHLRVGELLDRGSKAKVEAADDLDETYTWETLRDCYGLKQKPIWHDALEGIPLETREYYLSILRAKRRISTPPRIHVNTIHGVKGGQADHVIILSDMTKRTYEEMLRDPDSESRVAYVALTRAIHRATIVMPQGKYSYSY